MKNLIKTARNATAMAVCKVLIGMNPLELVEKEVDKQLRRNMEIELQAQEEAFRDFNSEVVSENFRQATAYGIKYRFVAFGYEYGSKGHDIMGIDEMLRVKKIMVPVNEYINQREGEG